ncbi:MAG: hypothetical protein KM296_00495 [Brockia lithotrophica]|nr:hypothetical protein [Brockia lithotrophica]
MKEHFVLRGWVEISLPKEVFPAFIEYVRRKYAFDKRYAAAFAKGFLEDYFMQVLGDAVESYLQDVFKENILKDEDDQTEIVKVYFSSEENPIVFQIEKTDKDIIAEIDVDLDLG